MLGSIWWIHTANLQNKFHGVLEDNMESFYKTDRLLLFGFGMKVNELNDFII